MILPELGYTRPASLESAAEALAAEDGATALAGGQTLMNVLKLRLARPSLLVDISRLAELRGIEAIPETGGVRIGAAATYEEIAASSAVGEASPGVAAVADGLVDRQVRARGTIGGNLCLNDPGSNYAPVAVALAAKMHIYGPAGRRAVSAEEFLLAPYSVDLGPGELLEAVSFPALALGEGFGYAALQIGRDSWALARASVWLRANGVIDDARVAVGCALPSPARQPQVEDLLRGASTTEEAWAAAASAAGEGVEAPTDVHASGAYRSEMLPVMVGRAIRQAIEERRDD